ncbi:MAG: DUF4255 domain-containing protein [Acidimicrobiales bacterium]
MIADVDEGLRTLIKREALAGTDVDVLFDAPTRDWAAKRNTPTLDLYLYDIREDLKWRAYGTVDVKDSNGRTSGRQDAPKHFKLSYLVTAWTQRPEDEHRLLSAVLLCLLRHPVLPPDVLTGVLAEQGSPVRLSVALPSPDERTISEVWTALGGELKASLEVACLTAVDPLGISAVAPLVLEEPRLRVGDDEAGGRPRARPGRVDTEVAAVDEAIAAGREDNPGRRFTFRTIAGDVDR